MSLADYEKEMSSSSNYGNPVVSANEVNEIKESKFFNTLARFFSSDLKTQDKEMTSSSDYGKPVVSPEETKVQKDSPWFNFMVAFCSFFGKLVFTLFVFLFLLMTKSNPLFSLIISCLAVYFIWGKRKK